MVDISQHWKSKHSVGAQHNPPRLESTNDRIFVAASNVDRTKQEGCMPKIKIERMAKLVQEDIRSKNYNILSGA